MAEDPKDDAERRDAVPRRRPATPKRSRDEKEDSKPGPADRGRLPPYNEADISALIAGLGKGNPAQDDKVKALLRRILAEPEGGGLPAEILEQTTRAVSGER